MKKLFQLGAVFFAILVTPCIYAQDDLRSDAAPVYNNQVVQNQGCPADHPCEDQACNDCWCLYCHYEPCYYYTRRCEEYKVPCQKRCCRYVPKYYECQRCRYVPQYYCETVCRMEPEYYCVEDCKVCQRWVCDKHCKYVPKYYWKHTCGNNACNVPCPR